MQKSDIVLSTIITQVVSRDKANIQTKFDFKVFCIDIIYRDH